MHNTLLYNISPKNSTRFLTQYPWVLFNLKMMVLNKTLGTVSSAKRYISVTVHLPVAVHLPVTVSFTSYGSSTSSNLPYLNAGSYN